MLGDDAIVHCGKINFVTQGTFGDDAVLAEMRLAAIGILGDSMILEWVALERLRAHNLLRKCASG